MKGYRKIWLLSFCLSVLVLTCLILAFLLFMKSNTNNIVAEPEEYDETPDKSQSEFINPDDNVGAVTFTEDRLTEIARNIYSLDDYLNNISVKLQSGGNVILSAKIKDTEKLCENFPELKKYSSVLSVIENQNITVGCELVDVNGMASLSVEDISVAGFDIDKSLVTPFVEKTDFAKIFNVRYDSVDIEDGLLVFNSGVPSILNVEK